MRYSYNWLQEYFNQKLPPVKDLADLITLYIAEVETVQRVDKNLENIYLGKVLSIKKHPQADRLWLVGVLLGVDKKLSIVCGGINLREGMLVAVAVPGAKVKWHNEGNLVEIKKSKIRGEESEGMICTPNEIGLEDLFPEYQEKEILDLSSTISESNIGLPIAKILGLNDSLIEIENKNITNRPDLWSYFGIAQELGAILNQPTIKWRELKEKQLNELNRSIEPQGQFKVSIIDQDDCPSYSLFYLDNFKISSSPFWLRKKIFLTGHHSINNLVDLTNYILFEFGQPIHAFDAEKIEGSTILVRQAKNNERIEALDGEVYSLLEDDLVIADSEKPLVIAGIIGGTNSAVSRATKKIILEIANFNPITVRKTSQRLKLSTESSKRFERNINPQWTQQIVSYLFDNLKKIFPKCNYSIIFNNHRSRKEEKINFDFSQLSKITGFEIKDAQDILGRLSFSTKGNQIVAPLWRSDIFVKEDIIEEIVRINGLDKINPTLPQIVLRDDNKNNSLAENSLFIRELKNFFTLFFGLDEVLNYSFISEEQIKLFNLSIENLIKIKNPLSKNQIALRNSLIPGLFLNLQKNRYYFDQINIFEVGNIYLPQPGNVLARPNSQKFLPQQKLMIAGLSMNKNKELSDLFLILKGKIEAFLAYWNINLDQVFENNQHPFLDQCLSIGGIGFLGTIKPEISYRSKIDWPVVAFELNINQFAKNINQDIKYHPLRKFNLITRDFKIKFSQTDSYNNLINKIILSNKIILKTELISTFSSYLIIRFYFGKDNQNITNEEVNEIVRKINSQFDFIEES